MSWLSYNNSLFNSSDFDYFRFGTSGNNILSGYNGTDDFLEGNRGTDTLYGGSGNDVLVGVDPDYYGAGSGEYDRLNGGSGYDTFVLGDAYEAYYQGDGYAIIEDFKQGVDKLAVHGSSTDYIHYTFDDVIGSPSTDTVLLYRGDIIAIFEDANINLRTSDLQII